MFRQHAGYARFAYNWVLGEFKAGLDMGEWLSDKTDTFSLTDVNNAGCDAR